MNKINLQYNNKTKDFVDVVVKELAKRLSQAEVITDKNKYATDGVVWHLCSAKDNLPDGIVWQFNDLAMRCGVYDNEYFLQVDEGVYNRLEYEKFVQQAESLGLDFGVGKYWLMLQLTFPLEFWSLSKRQNIAAKIRRQQFRFLTVVCL